MNVLSFEDQSFLYGVSHFLSPYEKASSDVLVFQKVSGKDRLDLVITVIIFFVFVFKDLFINYVWSVLPACISAGQKKAPALITMAVNRHVVAGK